MDYLFAPERYQADGFILRSYDLGDGPVLADAINASYDHLRPWMPWAKPNQSLEDCERFVRQFRARYLLAEDFVIGVFSADGGRLLGGTGFHLREGPISTGCAEVGMFIRHSEAGRGLGSRVLRALLQWGFTDWPWLRCLGGVINATSRRFELPKRRASARRAFCEASVRTWARDDEIPLVTR